MQLALEIPKQLLTEVSPVADVDFALAHLVLEDEIYRSFYKAQSAAGRVVILDNSLHELGRPLSAAELWKAVDLIKPTVVIAPDFHGEAKQTLEGFNEMLKLKGDRMTGLALVIQGKTYEERVLLFDKLRQHTAMICFPYKEAARGAWFAEMLDARRVWPSRIHLLGVSSLGELRQWRDTFNSLALPHFRLSVDTGKPIKLALQGIRIAEDTPLRGLGTLPHTLDKAPTPKQWQDIWYNIAYLRKFM